MTSRSTDSPGGKEAWQHSLKLLAMRDYTRSALGAKLVARGCAAADIEAALGRLEEEGWLNDQRFAQRFAESAVASGRYFGLRLRHELLRRGVPAGIVEQVLKQPVDEEDLEGQIVAQLERRFPGFRYRSADDRDRRRVVGFLQRKGFALSDVIRVLLQSPPGDPML